MKILEHGEDRWRKFECAKCHSIVQIQDEDVKAELYWDEEDGCNDEAFHAICLCGWPKKFIQGVPEAVKAVARREARYSKEDVGSKDRTAPKKG